MQLCAGRAEKSIPVGKQKSANEFTYFDIVTNVSAVMRLMRTEFEPHIVSAIDRVLGAQLPCDCCLLAVLSFGRLLSAPQRCSLSY